MAANGELTVVERLASLLETGQFADVTIQCGSGNGAATFKVSQNKMYLFFGKFKINLYDLCCMFFFFCLPIGYLPL